MKKDMKKLSAMALTGLMGFSLLGTPVMAAPAAGTSEDTTKVQYVSGTNIDPNGRLIMTVPAAVELTKAKTSSTGNLTIKSVHGPLSSLGNERTFEVVIRVKSTNSGLTTSGDSSSPHLYKVYNQNGSDASKIDSWAGQGDGKEIARFPKTNGGDSLSSQTASRELRIFTEASAAMEKVGPGKVFSDTLTFGVQSLKINDVQVIPSR